MPYIPALIAAFTGLAGVCLGFFLSRWQKQRELLYARKLDLYSDLVRLMEEFAEHCALKTGVISRLYEFNRFMKKLFQARLVMPEILYRDIRAQAAATIDRIGAHRELWEFFYEVLQKEDKVVGQANALEDRFHALKKALEGEGKERFGPEIFEPLLERFPDIVRMLKRDLGIERLGGSFYRK